MTGAARAARGIVLVVILALGAAACAGDDDGQRIGDVVRVPRLPLPPPGPERVRAIGDVSKLPPDVQRALAADGGDFAPAPTPGESDWLTEHPERPQSFAAWERADPNRPDDRRRVLYLWPLGDLPADRTPPLDDLAAVVHAFFQLEVRVLPPAAIADLGATERVNPHTRTRQLLAPDVLRWMTLHVPTDAYAVMAVTMIDLYPDPTWNFVYGQATFTQRVGVQSFARYDPAFFGEARPADWRRTLARRSAQVLVHEIAHMFGIAHCTYWDCVAAGANHQAEFDAHPLHLCPVDLRKLWSAVGFDVAAREDALAAVWTRLSLEDEAAWSSRRAARIRGADAIRTPAPR